MKANKNPKLSEVQQEVIALMQSGWELGSSMTMEGLR